MAPLDLQPPLDVAGRAADLPPTEPAPPSLRVLSVSSLYPNPAQPRHGIFLQHRLAHLMREPGISLRMVAPVPWAPPLLGHLAGYGAYRDAPHQTAQRGIQALHPRYPAIPKFGMTVAAGLMAARLAPVFRAVRDAGFDFDVVDAYYLYPDGVAAAALAALFRRPLVLTAFGSDVNQLPDFAAVRAEILWAVRRAEAATSVCKALHDRLLEMGADPRRLSVVLHGVDLDLFQPPEDRAELRRRLGFDGPTLLSVGHLIPRKGHDIAIRALAELPGTRLIVAGCGPEEGALRRLAASLGVAERVRLLGHVDQKGLPDLMGAADALVLASDREGIANVLMEAMACGTPVVATPVWGSPEVVAVPEAGRLASGRTPAEMAEGVRRLLAAPPDPAATRRWAERFTWAETARQHAEILRRAAGRR